MTRESQIFDDDQAIFDLAVRVGEALAQRGWMLVTAESCTGGWVGQAVTAVAGSSGWYERGFITYSNRSKCEMLGVQQATLDQFGAASPQTAQEMAIGALNQSHAEISASITGIAGPDGGTATKPVGMVCFAWAIKDGLVRQQTYRFKGDRKTIRRLAVETALRGILDLLDNAISVA
ncbi:CinA family protein [Nitrosomonas supralitoralis]|uniref:Damage-inducible protein CinA n=1 Tax=Nitrosomonas supralitoralis TaxID=2116706 RepID=A0A2P7NS78_9PROT|nr:CinA family protein [Nitrosomonas supralitoralis]PSJ16305.1 damage-inducible protein CinA [Nitrosomonas supralitoralis]